MFSQIHWMSYAPWFQSGSVTEKLDSSTLLTCLAGSAYINDTFPNFEIKEAPEKPNTMNVFADGILCTEAKISQRSFGNNHPN